MAKKKKSKFAKETPEEKEEERVETQIDNKDEPIEAEENDEGLVVGKEDEE